MRHPDSKRRVTAAAFLPAFPTTQFDTIPLGVDSLRRFGVDDTGNLIAVPPSGYPTGAHQWINQGRYHFASRIGKYPMPTADQQQPGRWEGPEPTTTVYGGMFLVPERILKVSDANKLNPIPEYYGDTLVDSCVPGESPIIAQQLSQMPFGMNQTRVTFGWQQAPSILRGAAGTTTGKIGGTP